MNIRVDLNTPIKDGTEVIFRSPVDCSQVTGLIVYYNNNGNTASREFAFADAHGNNVGDIDHLFAENVAVKVILDVTTSMAFVQNADTNAYLEGRFAELEAKIDQGGGNVDLTDYVKKTDYATTKTAGLVKTNSSLGFFLGEDGLISIVSATTSDIDGKTQNTHPVTSKNLDYAIKVGLTTNTQTLTKEEQAAACEWLGVNALMGDVETALDSIIDIQNSLMGGGSE